MLFAVLFFGELLLLFLLSKTLTRTLSAFLYRLTRSKKITIYLMSVVFFPGTFLHEFSHALAARLLFVPLLQMEFMPKLENQSVKLGSVSVAKTDFLRRFLIGVAPFFIGTASILTVLFFAIKHNYFGNTVILFFICYVVFEIGNTMFSSKRDLEGAVQLFLILTLLFGVIYYFGISLPSIDFNSLFVNPLVVQTFQKACFLLLLPIGIDVSIIAVLKFFRV